MCGSVDPVVYPEGGRVDIYPGSREDSIPRVVHQASLCHASMLRRPRYAWSSKAGGRSLGHMMAVLKRRREVSWPHYAVKEKEGGLLATLCQF